MKIFGETGASLILVRLFISLAAAMMLSMLVNQIHGKPTHEPINQNKTVPRLHSSIH